MPESLHVLQRLFADQHERKPVKSVRRTLNVRRATSGDQGSALDAQIMRCTDSIELCASSVLVDSACSGPL